MFPLSLQSSERGKITMPDTMNANELRNTTGSVAVETYLKRKEAEALAQVFSPDEKPLLMFKGFDKRDKTTKKIILTDKSLYFVRSKIFRAAKVETVSLSEIIDIQEKSGIFSAKVAIMTGDSTITIDNVGKKASAKLVSIWREINGEYSEAKQNVPASEPKKSGLFEKVYKFAVLVIAAIFIKNMIEYKPEEKKEETPTPVTTKADGGKTVINLNTGEIAINKHQLKGADKFTPKYTVVEEDNLTLAGVPRFEQRISIPLGLSHEELKKNLLDAAWKLQKKKNAAAVVIFAFREDDTERKSGYTAGKCILAPFGDWAKAMENHDVSDLSEEIIISEAYDYNEPVRVKGSLAYVKDDGTELYRINKKADIYETITKLKKGTEVKILDSEKQFSIVVVADIYRVQARISRKKTLTGWIYGYQLTDRK